MRSIWLILTLTIFISVTSFSATHTITNSGFSFSPSTLTINLGDTITFVLAGIHDAREVSQSTWDANGTTSNGGFETPFGGGTVILQTTGTHYYVCINHVTFGMKGIIVVNPSTFIHESDTNIPKSYSLEQNYPKPFQSFDKNQIQYTTA
jgi:plastocyanin